MSEPISYEKLLELKEFVNKYYVQLMHHRAVAQEHLDKAKEAERLWESKKIAFQQVCTHQLKDGSSAVQNSDVLASCTICGMYFDRR